MRPEERPGVHIAESVDALLFSLVLLVLSFGTAGLFLTTTTDTDDKRKLPEWMRIKSLTELKLLLWEAILATLVVAAASSIIAAAASPRVEAPGAARRDPDPSVSYFLLKRTESGH